MKSWLDRLHRMYRRSSYRYTSFQVRLKESPSCVADFTSLPHDSLLLNFENIVDDWKRKRRQPLVEKCDILAVGGTAERMDIVMVEVKGGESTRPRVVEKASSQLANSKRLIECAIRRCKWDLPETRTWRACVVMRGVDQRSIARNEASGIYARFRRETRVSLQVALCGQDIGGVLNDPAS